MNMMADKKPDEKLTQKHIYEIGIIVEKAKKAGVTDIVNVGTSLAETYNSLLIAATYEHVYATAGIHPCDVVGDGREQLKQLSRLVVQHRHAIVGIGETGLDFYHKPFDADAQAYLFEGHIELALRHNLPLVVHIRDAGDTALAILEKYRHEARGVLHCFSTLILQLHGRLLPGLTGISVLMDR